MIRFRQFLFVGISICLLYISGLFASSTITYAATITPYSYGVDCATHPGAFKITYFNSSSGNFENECYDGSGSVIVSHLDIRALSSKAYTVACYDSANVKKVSLNPYQTKTFLAGISLSYCQLS